MLWRWIVLTLGQWLRQARKNGRELAEVLGCNPATVSRYCTGARLPRTAEEYRRIYLATDGQVTPDSFFPMSEWADELKSRRLEREAA